ncbi:hypothetical protein BWI17_21365 [Betaproteobacteria bacterium GR16-43]|nr:hypothetical protein BWI17_21365 [Betaproteobacteria bacterium GR16-43]
MATLDPVDRLDRVSSEVWTVNPPGFGATTGPPDLERYADCAEIAVEALRRHADGKPIWVCGKSIGTAAALLAVAGGGVTGAILRNAMPLRKLLERHYFLRTAGLSRYAIAPAIPKRLDGLANARNAAAAAIFLVSKGDRVVPPSYQHEIIESYRGPKTVLEVAGGHDERSLQADDEIAYRRLIASHLG